MQHMFYIHNQTLYCEIAIWITILLFVVQIFEAEGNSVENHSESSAKLTWD